MARMTPPPAADQLERADHRLVRARAVPRPARGRRRRRRAGRPGRGSDDAGARPHEHELPHVLRPVAHPRLGRRAAAAAGREAAALPTPRCGPPGRAGASDEAGVFRRLADWGRYVIGDTYSAANAGLKGQVVEDIAASGASGPVRHAGRHRASRRLPHRAVAHAHRQRPRVVAMRPGGVGRPRVMLGGSDAGAHLDRMCGSCYTTRLLADCLRGRQLASLERAVQMMTQEPAELFGLVGRGTIAPGNHADLVLFDPETHRGRGRPPGRGPPRRLGPPHRRLEGRREPCGSTSAALPPSRTAPPPAPRPAASCGRAGATRSPSPPADPHPAPAGPH